MTIRTVCRPPVKPTRHAARPARPFGEGIFTRPARVVPSDEDLAWATVEPNRPALDFDVVGPADSVPDALAAEARAEDAVERSLIPIDVAESIARTSLVGHPA